MEIQRGVGKILPALGQLSIALRIPPNLRDLLLGSAAAAQAHGFQLNGYSHSIDIEEVLVLSPAGGFFYALVEVAGYQLRIHLLHVRAPPVGQHTPLVAELGRQAAAVQLLQVPPRSGCTQLYPRLPQRYLHFPRAQTCPALSNQPQHHVLDHLHAG